MRHNRDEKRFNRTAGHLRCMLANMTNDLITTGAIRTTTPKAKLLRRYAERMITLGKKDTLASRRRAMAFMRSKTAVTKLFAEVAPRFMDRNGGYTRIMKLGFRPGDSAPMSRIELVEAKAEETKPKSTGAKARKRPARKSEPKGAKEAKGAKGAREGKGTKEARPKRAPKAAKKEEAE